MKRAAVLTLALAFWAGGAAPEAGSGTPGATGTQAGAAATEPAAVPGAPAEEPTLRTPPPALTPAEYNNTIADLLGFRATARGGRRGPNWRTA